MDILDPPTFWALVSFAVGATIGSFLNVVIYRVPRELSVNEPRRSFCPSCNYLIPFYHNIPLVSWLVLRGKCKNCGAKISMRYWWVELLTALLFVAAWYRFGWDFESGLYLFPELVPVIWILLAGLVSATFIDIEHKIIPDSINYGGIAIGLIAAFVAPSLCYAAMACAPDVPAGMPGRLHSLLWSVTGAALGGGLLYAVVVFGKLAFGRKQLKLPEDCPFEVSQPDEDAEPVFDAGGIKMSWDEVFFVGSECVQFRAERIELDGKLVAEGAELRMWCDRISVDGEETNLEDIKRISGKTSGGVRYLREAMGLGDVKFMAMVGAFLGWKAVLFTVFAASVAGTAVALPARLLGKGEGAFSRIPFGPYLALGAVIWIFTGPEIVDWYFNLLRPPPPVIEIGGPDVLP